MCPAGRRPRQDRNLVRVMARDRRSRARLRRRVIVQPRTIARCASATSAQVRTRGGGARSRRSSTAAAPSRSTAARSRARNTVGVADGVRAAVGELTATLPRGRHARAGPGRLHLHPRVDRRRAGDPGRRRPAHRVHRVPVPELLALTVITGLTLPVSVIARVHRDARVRLHAERDDADGRCRWRSAC